MGGGFNKVTYLLSTNVTCGMGGCTKHLEDYQEHSMGIYAERKAALHKAMRRRREVTLPHQGESVVRIQYFGAQEGTEIPEEICRNSHLKDIEGNLTLCSEFLMCYVRVV